MAQTQQDQVNNLVSSLKNELGGLLIRFDNLQRAVDYYNAIGGATTVAANPPSGDNGTVTAADVTNVVTHVQALITDLNSRKAALLEILDGVPG